MIEWPGPSPEADVLVYKLVLEVDMRSVQFVDGRAMVDREVLPGGRSFVPHVTRNHAHAILHVADALEEEGWFSVAGNERGLYVVRFTRGGREVQGESRTHMAEAYCIAALRTRGYEVRVATR